MKGRVCELCKGDAAVYCPSDSAFLCWNCDAKVHEANFLVARHVRCTVCSKCNGLTDNRISGVGFQPHQRICRSCSHESPGDYLDSLSSSSSSSACISSAESCATTPKKIDFGRLKMDKVGSSGSVTELHSDFLGRYSGEVTSRKTKSREAKTKTKTILPRAAPNVNSKAEGVLVNWCRKLGLNGNCAVPVAIKCFSVCLNELTVLPFRVSLAASLWFSLRMCGDRSVSTWQVLKRLEEISGVPAKVILASGSKLARILSRGRPRNDQQKEGWAECSV